MFTSFLSGDDHAYCHSHFRLRQPAEGGFEVSAWAIRLRPVFPLLWPAIHTWCNYCHPLASEFCCRAEFQDRCAALEGKQGPSACIWDFGDWLPVKNQVLNIYIFIFIYIWLYKHALHYTPFSDFMAVFKMRSRVWGDPTISNASPGDA